MPSEKRRTDAQARALVIAGGLLQGAGVKIATQPGERYPDAVERVLAGLEASERDELREDVRWVLDYEKNEPESGC